MRGLELAPEERVQIIRLDAQLLEFIVINPAGEVTATVRMTTERAARLGVIAR
ncbi:hypothetical protein [Streptomyces sp. URMC 124]|uniref:hypothetical protein n=1 Tax=Streptomyces sp. URMC 124 TaxID=3423405 RepID=UPI003F1ADABD